MTLTEERYALILEQRRRVGEIDRWDYEPVKLRLADRTYYAPDFRVILSDGTEEFHEVKPANWDRIPNQDMSNVKIKVAAEHHPYVFLRAVEIPKRMGGGFDVQKVGE